MSCLIYFWTPLTQPNLNNAYYMGNEGLGMTFLPYIDFTSHYYYYYLLFIIYYLLFICKTFILSLNPLFHKILDETVLL